jgi:iron complex outermembrane receptor protein
MTRWWDTHDDQFLNPQSEFFIEGPQKLSSLLRSSLWMWGGAVFFMIVAMDTLTSEWVWAETASAPSEIAAILQTDSDLMKEDLKFLQEESVSIAVAHEQPISQAPSNVYVITEEDIRHSGAIDIPTILRRIPGMEVIQMTAAHFDVSVRGDNQPRANKLLVLIDGRSIYRDEQGEVLWKLLPISLLEIKRIEVLKGPASVLYGFNAFDGVVNIITKSPKEMKGLTMQFAGGEYGTLTSSAILGGMAGKNIGYKLSLGQDQTNQWDDRNGLAFRNYRFNGLLEYTTSQEGRFQVSGGFANSNQYKGPNVGNVEITQEPVHSYASLVFNQQDFLFQAYWNRWDQSSPLTTHPNLQPFLQLFNKDGGPNIDLELNSYTAHGRHGVSLGQFNKLTYGIEYRHNRSEANFLRKTVNENRLGLYVQDEWQMFPKLTSVAGVRMDMDTFINPTYSPRLSVIYQPHADHSLRATGALGYRPPTGFESNALTPSSLTIPLPFPPGPITTPRVFAGNNNLDPEQIISVDMGYQGWYLRHRLRFRMDLFYNHLSDLIGQFIPPGTNTRVLVNEGEADIYGGEAGVEFLVNPWLTGFANYAYQEIHQTITSNDIPRTGPRFKINGGLRAELDNGWNGEAALHYVGSVTYPLDSFFYTVAAPPFNGAPPPSDRIGSYFLLNLRGGYRFWEVKGTKMAEIGVSVFNALNDKHQEHPLGEQIASRVLGWLTIKAF